MMGFVDELFMANSVLGKDIKRVRQHTGLSEPKFARLLSRQTGELITSLKLIRMENFGRRDACTPLSPSIAVTEFIQGEIKKLQEDESESEEEEMAEFQRLISENHCKQMSEEDRDHLSRAFAIYKELGAFETKSVTAKGIASEISETLQRKKAETDLQLQNLEKKEKELIQKIEDSKRKIAFLSSEESKHKSA
jgi:AraC-like DNA-binding protein